MNAAGQTSGTDRTQYVNASLVFLAAVKDRVIGSDPTDGARLPAPVARTWPCRPQRREEVGQLMAVGYDAAQALFCVDRV